jgi:hypothetical protein
VFCREGEEEDDSDWNDDSAAGLPVARQNCRIARNSLKGDANDARLEFRAVSDQKKPGEVCKTADQQHLCARVGKRGENQRACQREPQQIKRKVLRTILHEK